MYLDNNAVSLIESLIEIESINLQAMVENFQETIRIYTGPSLLVKGLVSRLNDLGIVPIERNDNESSIQAGFTVGVPGQIMLYIRKDELPLAQDTIDEYLKDIGE